MEKTQPIDYRVETEIRLLATALLSENIDIRDTIFNFSYFTTDTGKQLYKKLSHVYITCPDSDYSAYISALSTDEQAVMMSVLKTAVSQTVDESRVDVTLDYLRKSAVENEFKRRISEVTISNDYTAEDIRQIVDDSQEAQAFAVNSLQKYLDEYSTPIELIPTGFPKLDKMLNGGIMRGTIGTIGARPSVGKTTFAINMAVHNPDIKILFFSLEMSGRMIYDKIVADVADIDYAITGKHGVNFETVKAVLSQFSNMTIIDNVSEIERIVEIIRQLKPDLVFIDYVQIIQSKREFESTRQRVDYISQLVKRTAKQMNISILNLSQLTRGAKEEPTMSALKESGGLEQDSDYIILLKRPFVNDKSNKDILPSDTTLKLDKNKFGDTGEISYFFDGAKQRFTEIESKPTAHLKKGEYYGTDDDLPF